MLLCNSWVNRLVNLALHFVNVAFGGMHCVSSSLKDLLIEQGAGSFWPTQKAQVCFERVAFFSGLGCCNAFVHMLIQRKSTFYYSTPVIMQCARLNSSIWDRGFIARKIGKSKNCGAPSEADRKCWFILCNSHFSALFGSANTEKCGHFKERPINILLQKKHVFYNSYILQFKFVVAMW